MKLLLDANLSWRMTAVLKLHFDDCFHGDSFGLTVPAKDSEIWEYAMVRYLQPGFITGRSSKIRSSARIRNNFSPTKGKKKDKETKKKP
jgi:hypothetical protein